MKHVLFQVMTDDLPQVALELAQLGNFSPDFRPFDDDRFTLIPGQRFRDLHKQAAARMAKVAQYVETAGAALPDTLHVVDEAELEQTNEWLGKAWEHCSAFEEAMKNLDEEAHMVDQLEEVLRNFSALNMDLSLLEGEKLFLDIRVGLIPRGNVQQLGAAVRLADYFMFPFIERGENAHIIVVGPKGAREHELTSVLDTAGFRPLPIPPELRDKPENVKEELRSRRESIDEERTERVAYQERWAREQVEAVERARQVLALSEPYVKLEAAARSSGLVSVLSGWMPARELRRTDEALSRALSNPFHLDARDPRPEERHLVPSYMRKSALLSPFGTLVKQYGIPRYGEIDPTAIFAVSFIAMFGMMFGDIGHGLTIVAAALLARRKLRSFTPFAVCVGLSATLFGVLYGSVFGYEELFHAVWIPPLSDPLYMLSVALAWGIGFLIVITLIAIHNRVVERDLTRAVFDTNGVISITLYLGTLAGVFNLYRNGEFGLLAGLVATLSLAVLFAYKLAETTAPLGERILIAFIETFETLTGYVSNTLSFLRVAAFSLNHVALAIAVFTLADMMDTAAGQLVTVVLGNLFILVLEGAIVTIQALRLEYYEGFSRFYSGDGYEFRPLTLEGAAHGQY